jgi:hypothetical protein
VSDTPGIGTVIKQGAILAKIDPLLSNENPLTVTTPLGDLFAIVHSPKVRKYHIATYPGEKLEFCHGFLWQ